MTDLLFIELGAVVTEIKGSKLCTIELLCKAGVTPTYRPEDRIEVDFTESLDAVMEKYSPAEVPKQAHYDLIVAPMPERRVPVGPSWPGGGHEGIVCIREDLVKNDDRLIAAANSLAGPRCKYQVIASIAEDKQIRRYHGLPAQVVKTEGEVIVLQIGKREGEIKYDPKAANADEFYAGDLVEGNVLRAGTAAGTTGAVFLTETMLLGTAGLYEELPKLPPSAGL